MATSTRRNRSATWLATVPKHVIDYYETTLNQSLEEIDAVRDATLRLLTDERMREPWRKLSKGYDSTGGYSLEPERWGQYFFMSAHTRFRQANDPDSWDALTRTEQRKWFDDLDSLCDRLQAHFKVSPFRDGGDSVGNLLSLDALIDVVERLGLKVVEPDLVRDDNMRIVEQALGPDEIHIGKVRHAKYMMKQSFVAGLKSYAARMRHLFPPDEWQPLAKPRDANAPRYRFVIALTSDLVSFYDQRMQELVATTAEVMFEDPGINVRLVRRYTTGR